MAVTRAERVMTAGERDFSGVEIRASDELDGANLAGVDLSRSILAEMSLDRVNFSDMTNYFDKNFVDTVGNRDRVLRARIYLNTPKPDFAN